MDAPSQLPVPISLSGLSAEVSDERLIDLMRYFIRCKPSESNPEIRKRYDEIEPMFARLIGFSPDTNYDIINQCVLYYASRRIFRDALTIKGTIGKEEFQQFAYLKTELKVNANVTEIFKSCTLSVLYDHLEELLKDYRHISPEKISNWREQVSLCNPSRHILFVGLIPLLRPLGAKLWL
jgi:hypothetical protein